MNSYSDEGITIASILDTRRPTKDGLFPVKIRVTYKRDRKYYATGKSLSIAEWDKLPDTKITKFVEIKKSIGISFDKVKASVKSLIKNDLFSFENLNRTLGKGISDNLKTAFQSKIESNLKDDKVSTADWYKYAIRSISLFAGDSIQYNQITVEWLKRYEKHLLAEGKSYTTISMYMRALQVVLNDAKTDGTIKAINHPFGKGRYEIPQHSGRNMALTLPQIGKIVNYKCTTESMEMCRDLWFFLYLCNGMNVTDVCKLKFSNIINGEIVFYRQKTIAKSKVKKLIHATITPEMKVIIEKWGNKQTVKDGFIFPFLKGGETAIDERRMIKNITHLINDNIQKIGSEIEIPKISTYTARHSWATVLKRSGANIAYISEGLGHSSAKVTENYLAQFESEERQKNAKALTNF